MIRHSCGYGEHIFCRHCKVPVVYDEKRGLYCPKCRRPITMICPSCGKRW